MSVKPFTTITVGATSFIVDSITVTYTNVPFTRTEFDHAKLASVRTAEGVSPILGQLLGGVPFEVSYECAVGPDYIPRPLTPNSYPTDWNNINQKMAITKVVLTSGQSPETANSEVGVNALYGLSKTHANKIMQFQNRLAIFSQEVAYETLLAAQSDNIQTLYFTTGVTLTTPDLVMSNALISEFNYTVEYAIPEEDGGYEIYKGFSITLENRQVSAASSS